MENTSPAGEQPASNTQPVVPPAPAPNQKKGMPAWAIVLIIFGALLVIAVIACFALSASIISCAKNAEEIDSGTSIVVPDDSDSDSDSTPSNTISKGNCKFYECLTKVTDESTVSEVTSAFGFEPEKTTTSGASFDTYTWTFDDDHTIEMTVSQSTGSTITIKLAKYDDDEIAQKGVTFANVQTIKSNLNVGDGVSYSEFKDYMGGVDGVLIEVGSWNKYEWRSTTEKGYINGSFGDSGKCMFISGMTY